MKEFLTYLFWPNPGNATYGSPKVIILLALCAGLVVLSFIVRHWRKRLTSPMTRKLSRSWPTVLLSFGVVGLFLAISRVEEISFVSMRFLWAIWALSSAIYLFFQIKIFRTRHYEQLPTERIDDPREKYLPKRK